MIWCLLSTLLVEAIIDADRLGWRLQPIERYTTSRAEGGATCLTVQRLDALALPISAITRQDMDLCITDPIICTMRVLIHEIIVVFIYDFCAT
jgi:hypothetical protein